MQRDFEYIQATPADAGEISELYTEYFETKLSNKRISDLLKFWPSVKVCVDGKIVAFCYCERFSPDIFRISNIYVSGRYRSKDIGTGMLAFVLKQAASRGFTHALASNSDLYGTKEKKTDPHLFYTKNGFRLAFKTESTKVFVKEMT